MQEKIRYGKIPLSQEAIKTIAQTLDIILKSNQDAASHANTFLASIILSRYRDLCYKNITQSFPILEFEVCNTVATIENVEWACSILKDNDYPGLKIIKDIVQRESFGVSKDIAISLQNGKIPITKDEMDTLNTELSDILSETYNLYHMNKIALSIIAAYSTFTLNKKLPVVRFFSAEIQRDIDNFCGNKTKSIFLKRMVLYGCDIRDLAWAIEVLIKTSEALPIIEKIAEQEGFNYSFPVYKDKCTFEEFRNMYLTMYPNDSESKIREEFSQFETTSTKQSPISTIQKISLSQELMRDIKNELENIKSIHRSDTSVYEMMAEAVLKKYLELCNNSTTDLPVNFEIEDFWTKASRIQLTQYTHNTIRNIVTSKGQCTIEDVLWACSVISNIDHEEEDLYQHYPGLRILAAIGNQMAANKESTSSEYSPSFKVMIQQQNTQTKPTLSTNSLKQF